MRCEKNTMPNLLGRGLYTYREAAALTGLKYPRIREWFRGRAAGRTPVFAGDYQPVNGDLAISFHDLIDVFVAGQLREHGVTLLTVRNVYRRLEEELRTCHPFCRIELLSDGKIVFTRGIDGKGQEELVEVLTRQRVFPEILLPFLKTIDYDKANRLARRWRIAESILLDPQICFGAPIVERAGIPATILAASYRANHSNAEAVAKWYNVAPADVLKAVTFQKRLAA
jgi:uncharacterized protein (DUF433 family)